jgi:hypothetical protein
VQKKRKLTLKQFRPYFQKGIISLPLHAVIITERKTVGVSLGGFTLTEKNLFLVFCALRDVPGNVTANLPTNTIVLDREKLKILYTPSLSSCPQFILPGDVNEV